MVTNNAGATASGVEGRAAEISEIAQLIEEVQRRLQALQPLTHRPSLYIHVPEPESESSKPVDVGEPRDVAEPVVTATEFDHQHARKHRHPKTAFLFYALFALILGAPIFEGVPLRERLLDVIVDAVLLTAVFSMWREHHMHKVLALGFCLATLSIKCHYMLAGHEWVRLMGIVCQLCIFAMAIASLGLMIVRSPRVNMNIIYASLSKFMLIGVFWGYLYNLLSSIQPGALSIPDQVGLTRSLDFVYFSLMTLTTVGYGDITPVSPMARSLVMVEASVGVFYVAVLISRLVSLYEREKANS